ncbi:hypothetical protein FACS1894105_07460 [Clostridia bacterium]|nr:hypothetical protein FACS1894105_07460 [Clostridia bacterium]
MYTSTTSYRAGYKILAIILAAIMLITLLPVAVNGDDEVQPSQYYTIVDEDSVADIQAALQDKIDTIALLDAGGGTVTVTGSKTDADATLELVIPEGVTVVWYADYSGADDFTGTLIKINAGSGEELDVGTFHVAGGIITSIGTLIDSYGDLLISGGILSNASEVPLTSDTLSGIEARNITITDGTIAAHGYYSGIEAYVNISIDGDDTVVTAHAVTEENDVDFKGNPLNEVYGYAILAEGDITIGGGTVITDGGASGIHSDGDINIRGNADVTATAVSKQSGTAHFNTSEPDYYYTELFEEIIGYGIFASGDITISESAKVEAEGGTFGILSVKNVNIEGGIVISEGAVITTTTVTAAVFSVMQAFI